MLELLLLIVIANLTPVVARNLLRARCAWPLDGGLILYDGHPLFGSSKTWRGVVVACAATTACAPLLGLTWLTGLSAGALAMAGDLLASFIKRRAGIAPSGRAPLLDGIPEALLPALGLRGALALSWLDVAVVAILFPALVLLVSPLLYRLHIRRHPW